VADPLDLVSTGLPILVGMALLGLAILVIRHGGGHRHNTFFASLYSLSGLKSFSEGIDQAADALNGQSPLIPPQVFWELLAGFCALAMLPMLLLFAASFPRPTSWMIRRPALAWLAGVPSLLMAGLLLATILDGGYLPLFRLAVPVFNLAGVAVSVVILVLLARTRQEAKEPIERAQALYVGVGLLPGFVAGWAITALQFLFQAGMVSARTADAATASTLHLFSPLGELFAAGVLAFAILKYNVLGVRPGFRLGVKSFLVGFLFVLVFLVTQLLENLVLEQLVFGFAQNWSFLLSGAAGIVLFKPIERISERVSNRLLPKEDGAVRRALEVYRAQATYVLRDAKVTARELSLLRNLREQLGLSEAQARAVEEDVERTLHIDAPETGRKATGSTTTSLSRAAREAAVLHEEPTVVHAASPSHAAVPRSAKKAAGKPAKAAPVGKAAAVSAPKPVKETAGKAKSPAKAPTKAPKRRT
jgi:hypothetical protein